MGPAPRGPERLRLTPRSAIAAVALFGLTLLLLRLVVAAHRVLGWILVAAAVAGLLRPFVARLARRMSLGLAVAVVAVASVAAVGGIGYAVVDALVTETDRLERAAPAAARRIEAGGRFARLARDARLAERTEQFVEEVPERLRGGTPAQALRAAATRGVAYLATGVLTLFFLLHGGQLASGAAAQIRDERRRERARTVVARAFDRGFGYARGCIAMAAGAALLAFVLARLARVPGAVPLAVWVGLWDLVPVVGAFVGAIPIVVLAWVREPALGLALVGAFVAYQVVEVLVFQRRLEARTVRVGPFLTSAGGLAGLELYGLGGALVAVLLLTLAVAVVDEVAPEDVPPGRPG